jgi:RHS repeat-associated protein
MRHIFRSVGLQALLFLSAKLLCFSTAQAGTVDQVTYLHNDVSGNPIIATNPQAQVLWREEYKPFGERVRKEDGGTNSVWFHSKPVDADSGLSYFGARWYDPVIGRFHGMDPVGFDEDNLHSFNRYAYANNNPNKFTDADGRLPILIFVVPAIKVLGAFSLGYTAGDVARTFIYDGASAAAHKLVIEGAITLALGGAGKLAAKALVHIPHEGQLIYRVFGGDSKLGGASWSPINPKTAKNFRNEAGLPSGKETGVTNSGQYVAEGTLTDPSKVFKNRSALPLDGNVGGIKEYIIPNWMNEGAITIKRISGVNPSF